MTHLLHIDASPRGQRSHTRSLTSQFVENWQKQNVAGQLTYRDIGRNPLPHVTEDWIAAAFTETEKRTPKMLESLRLSDQLVDELLNADVIIAGIPFYNFGMPSGFKAYVDQIVRVGRTFGFDAENSSSHYEPLVHGKKLIAVISRGDGGYHLGGRNAHHNHLDPHLKTVFRFIGIEDITMIAVENDEFGGTALADSLAIARQELDDLAHSLVDQASV